LWRAPAARSGRSRPPGSPPSPFPHATADHQSANARYFGSGVEIVRDAEAARVVPGLVAELLADPERMRRMAAELRARARPDAAEEVAEGVLALVEARG